MAAFEPFRLPLLDYDDVRGPIIANPPTLPCSATLDIG